MLSREEISWALARGIEVYDLVVLSVLFKAVRYDGYVPEEEG